MSATTVAFTAARVAADTDVPIDVAIVEDYETLARLEPEWNALVEKTRNEPFYRHEYVASWIRSFTPQQPLKLLVGRNRAGRLVALLPLVEERTSICGIPATQWASPTNVHSYRFDLIASDPASACIAFLRRLRAERGWDVVRLTDVAPYGRAWQLQAAARAAGMPVGVYEAQRSTYISLPASEDELYAGLTTKFRSNLRRRRKLLEKKGKVSVELVTGGPELQEKLEQCFAIEQSGWKGRSGEPANHDPRIHAFYSTLAQRASGEGSFSLFLLKLDDRPIAFHYGLTQEGVYSLIMTSYDESLRDCSPGHLLVEEVLKVCIAEGRREFDFLGCDLEWKRAWSPTARPHSWLFLFRDSLRGRLLEAAKFRWAPALRRRLKREPASEQES